jgi:hypothetical protein
MMPKARKGEKGEEEMKRETKRNRERVYDERGGGREKQSTNVQ